MDYSQLTDAQFITFLHDPRVQTMLMILAIWDLAWRGVALWKSARNQSKYWFIALLILNTVGILPIIYIFFFADKKGKTNKPAA